MGILFNPAGIRWYSQPFTCIMSHALSSSVPALSSIRDNLAEDFLQGVVHPDSSGITYVARRSAGYRSQTLPSSKHPRKADSDRLTAYTQLNLQLYPFLPDLFEKT